jgi:hypothetical protein
VETTGFTASSPQLKVKASVASSELISNRDLAESDFKGLLMGTAGSNRRVGGRLGVVATALLPKRGSLLSGCYM